MDLPIRALGSLGISVSIICCKAFTNGDLHIEEAEGDIFACLSPNSRTIKALQAQSDDSKSLCIQQLRGTHGTAYEYASMQFRSFVGMSIFTSANIPLELRLPATKTPFSFPVMFMEVFY